VRQLSSFARRSLLLAMFFAAAISSGGCASGRIGLANVEPAVVYRGRFENALDGPNLVSSVTRKILRRYGLICKADLPPCIGTLHASVVEGTGGAAELFALAEMSLIQGDRLVARYGVSEVTSASTKADRRRTEEVPPLDGAARSRYLAAAIYAYAFLFAEDRDDRISLLDPRSRPAADIYARGLAEAFSNSQPGGMFVAGGRYRVPFGYVDVAFDEEDRNWGARKMGEFRWPGTYTLYGLNNRYRDAGIGVPVAARTYPRAANFDFVSPDAWVPATILLRIDAPRRQLASEEIRASLEIYSAAEASTVVIGGRELPLETDPSTALAATMEQSRFWENNFARFLGKAIRQDRHVTLAAQDPYADGKIPVVFVHGTDSHPSTWANMVNDLQYDREIRERFHFWFFEYDSGNPILYSAMLLRRSLNEAESRFRSEYGPGCLDEMVVIGHSQGGLLTKLTVVDSGTLFWDRTYSKPFDDVPMKSKTRALLRESMFVEPLPYVDRVVFISTPHRGSFLASSQFVQRLASSMIKLPRQILEVSADMARVRRLSRYGYSRPMNSIDNMSPGNPFIRTLSGLSVVPGVHQHSIISLNPGESEETGSDGVVKYKSAHIEGVDSELVVRSGHTTLANPHTVEEVRRILKLHAAAATCGP